MPPTQIPEPRRATSVSMHDHGGEEKARSLIIVRTYGRARPPVPVTARELLKAAGCDKSLAKRSHTGT